MQKLCAQIFFVLEVWHFGTLLAQENWRKSCSQNVGEIDYVCYLYQNNLQL